MIKTKKAGKIVIGTSLAVAFFAIAFVTASPRVSNTPLYTLRIERASSEMDFLPTKMNTFAYTTEKGCELNFEIGGGYQGDATPLSTWYFTCEPTCGYWTCPLSSCVKPCW